MDNQTYFSDSDEDNHSQNDEYESDSSLDEETRRIVFSKFNQNDYSCFIKEDIQPKIKTKKLKEKKSISLGEFNKKIEENKPKKFISKRAEEKKKNTGIVNVVIRKFNPKKIPYNLAFPNGLIIEEKYKFNNNDFPSL